MLSTLKKLPKLLMDMLRFVSLEGKWSLDPIHLALIERVLDQLTPEDRSLVRDQLAQDFFLSWMGEGRINVLFFYDLDPDLILNSRELEDKTYQVDIIIDGKRAKGQVSFYQRRLFSVQITKPRSAYKGKEFSIGDRLTSDNVIDLPSQIDREEHGPA